jgi:hypothetical protein
MSLSHFIQIFYRTKTIVVLLVLLSGILSCTKFHDLRLQNSCRIHTWYVYGDPGEIGIDFLPFDFYYDDLNNPVEITIPDTVGWNETYHFYYDEKQRLINYTQIGYHHNLTYGQGDLAVIDTLLIDFAGGESWYEQKFFYDNQNRLIQTIRTLFKSDAYDPTINPPDSTNYRYDSNGNLELPGSTYALNTTNPFRLNKVFMFVFRNYSRNTPFSTNATYNEYGLPVTNANGEKLFDYQCNPFVHDK